MTEAVRFEDAALRIRTQRMTILASNIANADTPGYQARDIDFPAAMRQAMAVQIPLSSTCGKHIEAAGKTLDMPQVTYRVSPQNALDRNTVDMDVERAAFAENAIKTQFAMQNAVDEYTGMAKMFNQLRG